MTKSKAYSSNNIFAFLIFLSLFGCGNTLSKEDEPVKISNGNSANQTVKKFKLTKFQEINDFAQLPKNLINYQIQMSKFDFYLAQSPTQSSGGFIFEISPNTNPLIVCLRRPGSMTIVTTALTNPIALIRVEKGLAVSSEINYCN